MNLKFIFVSFYIHWRWLVTLTEPLRVVTPLPHEPSGIVTTTPDVRSGSRDYISSSCPVNSRVVNGVTLTKRL